MIIGKLTVLTLCVITICTITLNTFLMFNKIETFYGKLESPSHGDVKEITALVTKDIKSRSINIEVYSSKDNVYVAVDGIKVFESLSSDGSSAGIYVVVLNQATGSVMATRQFDVYSSSKENTEMIRFINMISGGRIICFAVKDEASYNLRKTGRNVLRRLGSVYINNLEWRDMWAMVSANQGKTYAEVHDHKKDLTKWADPVVARTTVELTRDDLGYWCKWGNSEQSKRRKAFCDKYEGYEDVCSCSNPTPIDITSLPLPANQKADIPVAVIASNRPQYLSRSLRSMLSAHGAKKELFTVFIDGFATEPADVAKLYGIKVVHHVPISKQNARIGQHYKRALTETFNSFPDAKYMIILEEDLDVSVDIFSYFSQLSPLMDEDESLYCISAWNDQGYNHSCKPDPSLLYRIEGMPGLGWLLKRRLYKDELEPIWPTPEKMWDWDMWMRMNIIRKGRECIIPDISRTYHFGTKGLNVDAYFQELHFVRHPINTVANVKLKTEEVKKENYEVEIERLLSIAAVLNHTKNPCEKDFVPDTTGRTYVFYIEMKHSEDWTTWMNVAECFHIWDIDSRGYHKSMWRLWLKGNQVLIVGSPDSPYAKHKPNDLQPIFIRKNTAS